MGLEKTEKEKYDKVWDFSFYKGSAGIHHIQDAFDYMGMKEGESIIDYGCGTAFGLHIFYDRGMDVLGVDITKKAPDPMCDFIPFIEAPLWRLPRNMPVSDYAYCTDVLEHIPESKVHKVLENIASHTLKMGLIRIAHRHDTLGPRMIGEYLHQTLKNSYWWKMQLLKYFEVEKVIRGGYAGGKERPTVYVVKPRNPARGKLVVKDYRMPLKAKIKESVVIVGHGPSLIGAGRGKEIDRYNIVIRFCARRNQTIEDFGVDKDIIVASMRNHSDIINEGYKPQQSWIFCRPKALDYEKTKFMLMRLKKFNPVICKETWPWAYRYKELGATKYIDPRQGEPGLIPSFTQGTATAIMACHRFRPKVLTLAGFDNVWAGQDKDYLSTHRIGHPDEPEKGHVSGHDLRVEKILIGEIAEYYGVEIKPL